MYMDMNNNGVASPNQDVRENVEANAASSNYGQANFNQFSDSMPQESFGEEPLRGLERIGHIDKIAFDEAKKREKELRDSGRSQYRDITCSPIVFTEFEMNGKTYLGVKQYNVQLINSKDDVAVKRSLAIAQYLAREHYPVLQAFVSLVPHVDPNEGMFEYASANLTKVFVVEIDPETRRVNEIGEIQEILDPIFIELSPLGYSNNHMAQLTNAMMRAHDKKLALNRFWRDLVNYKRQKQNDQS